MGTTFLEHSAHLHRACRTKPQSGAPDRFRRRVLVESTRETTHWRRHERCQRGARSRIPRSVDQDPSLSPEAHDVTISARKGFVTLRGPVNTNIERLIVGEKAKDFAGDKNAKNELLVVK